MTGTLDTAAWESELAGDSPEALKAMKNGIEQTTRL